MIRPVLKNSQLHWASISFFLLALVVGSQECQGQVMVTRTETFDSDPGWDGHNNRLTDSRSITQDFGYSSGTSNAGGPSGEVGGRITPAGEPAYYAKVISELTFQDAFTASGTMNADGPVHTQLGFFNVDTINEWRTPNTLTMRILGRGSHLFAYSGYGTELWRAGENAFLDGSNPYEFADGSGNFHDWSISYDPLGNSGQGQITAILGGETVITNLDPGHKSDGATFNRFGLLDTSKSADSPGTLWIDNVTVNGGATDDFSSDPGWDSLNNDITYVTTNIRPSFNFGYSPASNLAGGQSGGEMGGQIFRGDSRWEYQGSRMAFYGDQLDETLTLDGPLQASGKVGFHRGVSDSSTLIGFFHSTDSIRNSNSQQSGFPENFVGAVIEGPSSEGFHFYPSYGVDQEGQTSSGRGTPTPPYIYPNGDSHNWTLDYDPAAGGSGQIVVGLDGQFVTLNLNGTHRQIGAHFDRFGIITTHIDGNGQTVYFDDLTYTVGITEIEDAVVWNVNASADLASADNWSPSMVPVSDSNVILGSKITASRVLFADTDLTMKTLLFDNVNTYVLAGQGSINFEAAVGDAEISTLQGDHEFRVQVNLSDDLSIDVLTGTTLTFNNGLDLNGHTLTKVGGGDLVINNRLTLDGGSLNGTIINNVTAVPEPSSLLLFGWGLVAMAHQFVGRSRSLHR